MAPSRRPLQVNNAPVAAEEPQQAAVKSREKDGAATPTKVLRSGRRVAATPSAPASTRRGAMRVAVHPPLDSHLKAPARRVPAANEEAKSSDQEAHRGPSARNGALRVLVDSERSQRERTEQSESEDDLGERLASNVTELTMGVDGSPICGLVQTAGSLALEAGPPPEQPPAGLLTAIRQAQHEVSEERRLSALCAEILGFQQEVQRESGSSGGNAASAATSTAASGDRYQDTPSGRQLHGGFSRPQSAAASSQAAVAAPALVPLEQALLGGSSCSGDDSGSESEEEESPPDSPTAAERLASGIRGQLAVLRLSQEHASELDTDGSDAADKLEALRTRLAPAEAGGLTPAELRALAAAGALAPAPGGGGPADEGGVDCPAFVPRPAPAALSFMERRLCSLQEAEWAGEHQLQPHKSALERAKEEAAAARRQSLGSADKAATRRLVRQAMAKAVQSEGRGLGEALLRHKCRLEREKEAAAAEAAARGPQAAAAHTAPATAAVGEGLGEGARQHKHRLQVEKEAAAAARRAGEDGYTPLPGYMRSTAAFRHAHPCEALGAAPPHRSRLEREKAAAAAAGGEEPRRGNLTERGATGDSGWADLGSMKVHKSRLEREKEEAIRRGSGLTTHRRAPRMAAPTAAWEGGSLADLKVHRSRMEKEVAAWKAASNEQRM